MTTSPSRGLALLRAIPWPGRLALALGVLLLVLTATILREGPDQTESARVTSVDLHQLCLDAARDPSVCLQVDSPQDVASLRRGECASVRFTTGLFLESARAADTCSPNVPLTTEAREVAR
jgi:hypothetical protein